MTTLRTEALSYGVGEGRHLVDAVDLTAADGETVGLVGPNGSGKTTLLRCVYGTLRPTHGRVLLDGDDLATLPVKARAQRIATVPQDGHAGFELTVGRGRRDGPRPAQAVLGGRQRRRHGTRRRGPRPGRDRRTSNSVVRLPLRWRTPTRPGRPRPGPAARARRPGRADQPPGHPLPAGDPRPGPRPGHHQPRSPCTTSTSPPTTATACTSSRTAASSPPAPRRRSSRRTCSARSTASRPRSAPTRRRARRR